MSVTIDLLIRIILMLVVAGVLWWCIDKLLSLLPVDARIRTVISVLAVLIFLLVVLQNFGSYIGF